MYAIFVIEGMRGSSSSALGTDVNPLPVAGFLWRTSPLSCCCATIYSPRWIKKAEYIPSDSAFAFVVFCCVVLYLGHHQPHPRRVFATSRHHRSAQVVQHGEPLALKVNYLLWRRRLAQALVQLDTRLLSG